MLLGIDVGGTFTDAVLIDQGVLIAQAKTPTRQDALLDCLMTAMDQVLVGRDCGDVTRVGLSTTIVTNGLAQGKEDKPLLFVMPGPGLNVSERFPVKPTLLSGYVDHRGNVVAPPQLQELTGVPETAELAVVSGKFAVRNPVNEQAVVSGLTKTGHFNYIAMGSAMSGALNFNRRTNSAYYAAATWRLTRQFFHEAEMAIMQRGIVAPIVVLKADGGALPISELLDRGCEAIFTGPAASALGVQALVQPQNKVISLDIGGTTTDIAIWQDGRPVMARAGAVINGHMTAVRALLLRSIGIGGDSLLQVNQDELAVGPVRLGPAMAFGGDAPTLTDALLAANRINIGDKERALAGLSGLSKEEPVALAEKFIGIAVQRIVATIREMLSEYEKRPVYTVDDLVNAQPFAPDCLIGVGGAAEGLTTLVGDQFGWPVSIPQAAVVANAVGAAVARPTKCITLRADTSRNEILLVEAGVRQKIENGFSLNKAKKMVASWLLNETASWRDADQEVEVIWEEQFSLVRGFSTTGKIINLSMQIKPGVLSAVAVEEREIK